MSSLPDDVLRDAERRGNSGDVGLGCEPAVRPAFADEAVALLGEDRAACSPLAVYYRHVATGRRLQQLPRSRETGNAGAGHYYFPQPRSAAALLTTSATAATRPGSSFSDFVRSS